VRVVVYAPGVRVVRAGRVQPDETETQRSLHVRCWEIALLAACPPPDGRPSNRVRIYLTWERGFGRLFRIGAADDLSQDSR